MAGWIFVIQQLSIKRILHEKSSQTDSELGKLQSQYNELKMEKDLMDMMESFRRKYLHFFAADLYTPIHSIFALIDMVSYKLNILNALPSETEIRPESCLSSNIETKDIIACMNSLTKVMTTYISNFSEILSLEEQETTGEPFGVNIRNLIHEIVMSTSRTLSENGITAEISYLEDLPAIITIDVKIFKKIILHLITNAFAFATRGTMLYINVRTLGSISEIGQLQISSMDIRQKYLQITITHENRTLNDDNIKEFLHPYPVWPEPNREFGACAMNVAIAGRLIDLIGGALWVTCKQAGTSFHVAIPFTYSETPAFEGEPEEPLILLNSTTNLLKSSKIFFLKLKMNVGNRQLSNPDEIEPEKKLVLMADSSILNISILAWYIQNITTFTTVHVGDGLQALDAIAMHRRENFNQDPFALILLHMDLPQLNAYKTMQRIRAIGCQAPIIAILDIDDWKNSEFRNMGFSGILTRPFGKEELKHAIMNLGIPEHYFAENKPHYDTQGI
ncbi:hypothetical protein HK098_002532 [Nowakowskiella sp. JEL0407]|nr:hypothetical protein HK098_002532 [Nowakowskiella sp. JEL0407]